MKYFNKRRLFYILPLLFIFVFSSCFQKKNKNFEIVEENYNSALSFMKFEMDYERCLDSIHGIELNFQIDYPTISDGGLKKYGTHCNSLQIITFLLDEKGAKIKINKSDTDSLLGDFVYKEYNTTSDFDDRINQFFPFYKNNIKAGLHDFYFLIEAYPTNRT